MLNKVRQTINDVPALYGDFGLKVYDSIQGRRQLVLEFKKRNQITNQGREALLSLMRPPEFSSGAPYTVPRPTQGENVIWALAVGTNGTPPTIADTETTMAIVWQEAFDFGNGECSLVLSPPNSYHLSISKLLPASTTANGTTITEAGIFTRGDNDDPTATTGRKLYARQKFTPITKTSTMTIQFEWLLGITVQGS